jgi:hypothetical protein
MSGLLGSNRQHEPIELALAQALVARLPGQFPSLAAILAADSPEIAELKQSLLQCLNDDALGKTASGLCGLSLSELWELVGELSRRRLSAEQKRRRAEYLTRMRNREFGF